MQQVATPSRHTRTLAAIEREMAAAPDYATWRHLAAEHDERSGMRAWRQRPQSQLFDWGNIQHRLDALRELRRRGDDVGLLFALNEGIHGNQGGMGRDALYERAKTGTKAVIEDYISEIVSALEHIADLPVSDDITQADKDDFFFRASHCFGRSALMFSGAGSLGHFHTGVVKALLEEGLLPNVISGSSAGSVIAAVLGTHSDDELMALLQSNSLISAAEEEVHDADTLFGRRQTSTGEVVRLLEQLIPDLTFQEAYEKTGREISVTIAPLEQHQSSRLMNAITSPNVYIRSAVQASCAVPGVFPPVMLMAKNVYGEAQAYLPNRLWVDGAVTDDLPAKRLARLYGVNHYIVSQANPLALMRLRSERWWPAPDGVKKVWREAEREYLKATEAFTRRWMRRFPGVGRAANLAYRVNSQEYKGDINIVPDFAFVDPRKLLGVLDQAEIDELVDKGQRATWQKMDQIRITTAIGRTLEDILDHHGDHNVRAFYKNRNAGRRPRRDPTMQNG